MRLFKKEKKKKKINGGCAWARTRVCVCACGAAKPSSHCKYRRLNIAIEEKKEGTLLFTRTTLCGWNSLPAFDPSASWGAVAGRRAAPGGLEADLHQCVFQGHWLDINLWYLFLIVEKIGAPGGNPQRHWRGKMVKGHSWNGPYQLEIEPGTSSLWGSGAQYHDLPPGSRGQSWV